MTPAPVAQLVGHHREGLVGLTGLDQRVVEHDAAAVAQAGEVGVEGGGAAAGVHHQHVADVEASFGGELAHLLAQGLVVQGPEAVEQRRDEPGADPEHDRREGQERGCGGQGPVVWQDLEQGHDGVAERGDEDPAQEQALEQVGQPEGAGGGGEASLALDHELAVSRERQREYGPGEEVDQDEERQGQRPLVGGHGREPRFETGRSSEEERCEEEGVVQGAGDGEQPVVPLYEASSVCDFVGGEVALHRGAAGGGLVAALQEDAADGVPEDEGQKHRGRQEEVLHIAQLSGSLALCAGCVSEFA